MNITQEKVRLLAEKIKCAAEALNAAAGILLEVSNSEPQAELPSITTTVSPSATVDEPIEHSEAYLASKRQCVEVVPDAPKPAPEPITRQSLRALAEKLVAKGRLHMVKDELSKFGVTTLSALKTEHYPEVQKHLLTDLGE
jgi:hypothetical protein